MQTTTISPAGGQLKRFNIRIVTGGETAVQTTIARSNEQAWNIAFDLCERLLGDKPPRSISVKPVGLSASTRSFHAHDVSTPARSAFSRQGLPMPVMGAIRLLDRAWAHPMPPLDLSLPAQTQPALRWPAA